MADHASVIHSFVSPIADLPGSLVKPSDWNHGHIFQGGVDGDLLTKDSTQTDGVLFKSVLNSVNGRILSLTRGQGSVASSRSPTGDFLIIPFTLVKTNSCVLVLTQAFMTDTNNT